MGESTDNILPYAPPVAGAGRPLPLGVRAAFLVGSLCAAVAFFVPFAWDTSPLDVLLEWSVERAGVLILIAIPFLAGIAAAVVNVRRIVSPARLGVGWRVGLGAVAALTGSATIVFAIRAFADAGLSWAETVQMLTGPAVLVGAAGVVGWFVWRREYDAAAVFAVYAAFAGNAVTCLIAFWSDRADVGYWLTVVAVVAMKAEVVTTFVLGLVAPQDALRGSTSLTAGKRGG